MPEDMLARLLTPGVMHNQAATAMQCEVRQHSPRSVRQAGATCLSARELPACPLLCSPLLKAG